MGGIALPYQTPDVPSQGAGGLKMFSMRFQFNRRHKLAIYFTTEASRRRVQAL
jgi:hypothetical protein